METMNNPSLKTSSPNNKPKENEKFKSNKLWPKNTMK